MKILLSFLGNKDPFLPGTAEPGPVLSLLSARSFDVFVAFLSGPNYNNAAGTIGSLLKESNPVTRFLTVDLGLKSVVDYAEIFSKLKTESARVLADLLPAEQDVSVLLDPGTPQMQTSWILLVHSGALKARLLQGIPPRFAEGAYQIREIRLDDALFEKTELLQPEKQNKNQGSRSNILGKSDAFLLILEEARRAAKYDVTVLIEGESGTGKGEIARFIHETSTRADRPFLSYNCAALSKELADSELFGYMKGAFTGAVADRKGHFRSAEGGTLFLDEIGDLPMEVQAKLLKAVEEKRIHPVGSDKEYKVDVRIIAATNKELEKEIAEGRFRRDLYERLHQFGLQMPPLRSRREDIRLLADHFLVEWNEGNKSKLRLSDDVLRILEAYDWPGNIRELHNCLTRMAVAVNSDVIDEDILPRAIVSFLSTTQNDLEVADTYKKGLDIGAALPVDGIKLKDYLFDLERNYYLAAIRRTGGNMQKAADLLGIEGHTFRKAMKERFRIEPGDTAE